MNRILVFIAVMAILLISCLAGLSCENKEGYTKNIELLLSEKSHSEDYQIDCITEPFIHFLISFSDGEEKLIFLSSKKMGVSEEGYNGIIHLGILLSPDLAIQDILITEHNETQGFIDYIIESGYIEQIKQSADIEGLDAVSGATLSSQAIKRAVSQCLDIYRKEFPK